REKAVFGVEHLALRIVKNKRFEGGAIFFPVKNHLICFGKYILRGYLYRHLLSLVEKYKVVPYDLPGFPSGLNEMIIPNGVQPILPNRNSQIGLIIIDPFVSILGLSIA